ncbi:transmembrane protein 150A isoform X7 [Macaca fascicularis]|uniref:transmembrane protein 150A isoform X7 n=1 Tax=Macaca fascicularis TaxID=9541 RepID=UPI003D15B3CB
MRSGGETLFQPCARRQSQARAADGCGRNISRSYNESCPPDPAEQGGPKTCCTLDNVPLIRWIMPGLCTTLELVWPSLRGCSLSACTVLSPTKGPPPHWTWLWPICEVCWLSSPLSPWSSVESSLSMRVLSCNMGQPCVSGCVSSISSFSMAPSAMSLGQSPQTHWWLHCSLPLAGPASPPGAAAPPPTSTVPPRASL